jgi:hypothetical protein
MFLATCKIPKICVENPVCIMSSMWRVPDQIIQPYQFGDPAQKTTCLWLKNLPRLRPTRYDAELFDMAVDKGEFKVYGSGRKSAMWHANTGGGCGKERSVTYKGIAEAMADQWGRS